MDVGPRQLELNQQRIVTRIASVTTSSTIGVEQSICFASVSPAEALWGTADEIPSGTAAERSWKALGASQAQAREFLGKYWGVVWRSCAALGKSWGIFGMYWVLAFFIMFVNI
jgi:hypothetical protein